MAIPYRITKFKPANIFAIAIWGPTANFNFCQYFQLYGRLLFCFSSSWLILSLSLSPFLPPAYDILSDPEKRRQYDMFGSSGTQGGFHGHHFNYDDFFGGHGSSGFEHRFNFNFDDMFKDMFDDFGDFGFGGGFKDHFGGNADTGDNDHVGGMFDGFGGFGDAFQSFSFEQSSHSGQLI